MKKPQCHASVRAVLDEGASPSHADCGKVRDTLRPIMQLIADSQKQIAAHREPLLIAQLDAPDSDGQMERLHQTLRAWETDVQALLASAQRVRVSANQYERYVAEIAAQFEPDDEPANPDRSVP